MSLPAIFFRKHLQTCAKSIFLHPLNGKGVHNAHKKIEL